MELLLDVIDILKGVVDVLDVVLVVIVMRGNRKKATAPNSIE